MKDHHKVRKGNGLKIIYLLFHLFAKCKLFPLISIMVDNNFSSFGMHMLHYMMAISKAPTDLISQS